MKRWQKNILSMLVITGAGFLLFFAAFILAALVINGLMGVLGTPQDAAPPLAGKVIYLILILLISWLVLKSRLNDLVKAAFLTMPLMVILVLAGITLQQQSKWLLIGVGAAIVGTVLFYLSEKKLSWLYYFSTIYVAVLGLYIILFQVQI